MGITNAKKTEICNKYKQYLEIIDVIGNKVMLQKQLVEFVLELGIEKHSIDVTKALLELEHYQIIKKEQFLNTTHKVIVFKKYAIRYLSGATRSKDVGAVPKSNSPERVLLSVFKSHYILTRVIVALKQKGMAVTFSNIKSRINENNSSILYSKNAGSKYFEHIKENGLKSILTTESEEALNLMKAQSEVRKKSLVKGSTATDGKGKGNLTSGLEDPLREALENYKAENLIKAIKPKEKKLSNFNLDGMFNAYTYVGQIKKAKESIVASKVGNEEGAEPITTLYDVITITILDFDLFNVQDFYKIVRNISAIHAMFLRYFNNAIIVKLKYGVIAYDSVAEQNLREESVRKGINPKTKEPYKHQRFYELLKLNNVDEEHWKDIELKITNYNITDNYMDGAKYANILKSGGRPEGSKNKKKQE